MRKYINIISVLLMTAFATLSCNSVHQFPKQEVDPVMVNVNVEVKIKDTENKSVSKGTDITVKDITGEGQFPLLIPDTYTWRLVIEAYKLDNKQVVVYRKDTLLNTNTMDFVYKQTIPLACDKYHITAWVDHVSKTSVSDSYYSITSGLRSILLTQPTVANTDLKDCFFGGQDFDLTPYKEQWNANITLPVDVIRPVAKYIIVTNDVQKYFAKTAADLNKYTAKIFYQGFQPNGFDAYDNVLNDAQAGLLQTVKLKTINADEAIISFDYLLTNSKGSNVIVGIQIFDQQQRLVKEITNLTIPLTQGRLTIVSSQFLTKDYASGVTIDPDYDGIIDVVIPD